MQKAVSIMYTVFSFQSPTDGYCLVYLIDESQKASCLIANRRQAIFQ